MSNILNRKRVVLGISGGIAAYKTVELVRQLIGHGAHVDTIMTHSATRFVTPLTFETLTRHPVRTDVWEQWTEEEAGHVTLAEQADVMIIAPATANVIAKLAHGLADDMLTVSYLACPGPVIVAPAMDHHMYLHPATQVNLQTLRERGDTILGPDSGALASGLVGYGRLVETNVILGAIRRTLASSGPLAGSKIVISAGPTQEAIDPIRFITNHSTGKMGYALAGSLADRGADVELVSGPVNISPPPHVRVTTVRSAAEMYKAVDQYASDAVAMIMTAAVADYTPKSVSEEKVKKTGDDLSIELTRTVDILKTIDHDGLIKVGFAAETTNLIEYARGKISEKNLNLIIANDARQAMGSDESGVFLIEPDTDPVEVPFQQKAKLAEIIADRVTELIIGPQARKHNGHASTT